MVSLLIALKRKQSLLLGVNVVSILEVMYFLRY